MAIYVTSDLHGIALDKFKELLDSAHFGEEDFLFILGDVIDRGDEGITLLEWLLLQPNMTLLLGNHEAMLLSCRFIFEEITEESLEALSEEKLDLLSTWLSNGGEPTLAALRRLNRENPACCEAIMAYLAECPLYETIEVGGRDFLLCHTFGDGFSAERTLRDYPAETWLWSRPEPEDVFFPFCMTVFGHTPTGYYSSMYSGKVLKTATWMDIDTSPRPCLLRLDDMAEFYLADSRTAF